MRNYVSSLLGLILVAPCLAQDWVQIKPAKSPPGRWSHGMAFDLVRNQVVIFSGTGATNSYMDDTWIYNGTTWTQMTPKNKPPGRRLCGMVFHFARVNTVMFGGLDSGNTQLNDTWIWDGKDWIKMSPKTVPPARYAPAMAYDSARQRTVMFGGGSYHNDTWEWDGSDWKQVVTKNAPSARYTTIAYDSVRKRIIAHSGFPGYKADTWEYDGSDWKQIATKNAPAGRCCVGMAYDVSRQRTVLFGGVPGYQNDTWEYDGSDWTKMSPSKSPSGRYDVDFMVYDTRRKVCVLFGGLTQSGSPRQSNETWEYGGGPKTLTGTPATISIATGGTHAFALDAGTANANRLYWIFGSVTGTSPGVTLGSAAGSVTIPLNPDFYTDITIALANSPLLTKTRGALDASGKGSAAFNVPKITNQSAIGVKFYHAFLVYDAQGNFYLASNPVDVTLAK